ncbi:MAG: beta-propeller fold lactonase family protein [Acidobacteria bacterium]|nr:beta-propeller fold lactonase family protein [Acidobacteriota bacterium]
MQDRTTLTSGPSSRRPRLAAILLVTSAVLAVSFPEFELSRVYALSPSPISSSPIILNSADRFLWVCNPDNDTVTVVDVGGDLNRKVAEINVGNEPQSVSLSADNSKAYVANAISGSVSVIATSTFSVVKTIKVGAEPWACALSPNGTKLYVANSSSNSVSVIDTSSDTVVKTIESVGQCPRAIAITNDGDFQDDDEKVFVTNFLAQYRFGQVRPGEDAGKVGLVYVIRTDRDAVFTTINLEPLADTGFKSDGDALSRIAPSGAATVTTGAFPNILAGLAILGDRLYIPSTGSSPNGPVKFNVNVQGLVSVVDATTDRDLGLTVNLNKGIQFEPDFDDNLGRPQKRFVTNPYFIAFRHNSSSGYVISAASDQAVKLDLDSSGRPTINAPAAPGGADGIVRIITGKNPRAMVINQNDTRGYIWNYVSRDVTVVNLENDVTLATIATAAQPSDELGREVQLGKELFNSSIGPVTFNEEIGANEGLMADRGWCSCASCHPNGLTDGVVWMFPAGPRFSTPLNGTFSNTNPNVQRALNWSAIFDEVADFELNTRGVAGGRGLILLPNGTPDPNVKAFDPASHGRSDARDSITTYVQNGVRSPVSGIDDTDALAAKGRKVFQKAGCVQCHSGAQWTTSILEFAPAPPASALTVEQGVAQLTGQLRQVGTFNAADRFELVGTGGNIGKQALGSLGFNTPSLLGVFAFSPYLHNGTAVTLDEVLNNPAHVGSSAQLQKPKKRAALIQFIRSIDDSTPPF